ncbi:hypothetical protein [Aeoliella mucimassa]|uniref:PEP-CTERM protein-sorting domain-containing protein n=1 Tax=Aeoliella mucimassa TaxID=2527972 RepID=A0A518ANB8_9BACT|nr:hypothetical protein [Aeoliella mucimassa]QDU56210.1 hypothetical protein Pan181_24180 [Aeoliella mucimassa]
MSPHSRSKTHHLLAKAICAVALVIACSSNTSLAATFLPLGDLPQGEFGSIAYGISPDGNIVAGGGTALPYQYRSYEAVLWDSTAKVHALRDSLEDDGFERRAIAVNNTGDVAVVSAYGLEDHEWDAYYWSASYGFTSLGHLLDHPSTIVSGASDDLGVITGICSYGSSPSIAFRWSAATGIEPLYGDLGANPGNPTGCNGRGISADGKVIVGIAGSGDSMEAFRWTAESGMVGLGDLPGGDFTSGAISASADGSVIVGFGTAEESYSVSRAFYWSEVTGMFSLGTLDPDDYASTAELVSADGRLVFGVSRQLDDFQPPRIEKSFVWDEAHGMRSFNRVLETEFGLASDLAGWGDLFVLDISSDSLTLVGHGINPDGNREAWKLTLDHPIGIPEPASIVLVIAGVLAAAWRARGPNRAACEGR